MQTRPPHRQIYYFHGFDRRGPRYFNLWQKREARARADDLVEVGALDGDRWSVRGEVEAEFCFMDWSDLIGEEFERPFWVGLARMAGMQVAGLWQGFFGKVRRRDWALGLLLVWGFLPVTLLMVALGIAALGGLVAFLGTLAVGVAAFWLLKRFDRYLGVYYIANIGWMARRLARRDHPVLEARVGAFVQELRKADATEVLVVGHSIGAALAVRCLHEAGIKADLLTVGHSIPLVSYQKEANYLRDALGEIGDRVWIDVSAGRDALGFRDYDPSRGSAKCISPHFSRAFGAQEMKRLRWRGFETHFKYFETPTKERPSWDWLAVLSGKRNLQTRFEAEKPGNGQGGRRMLF